VQITTQHAKAVRERPGISVEERLLLDGIALHAAYVSPRDVKCASAIEAHFADAGLAFGNRAAVPAGKAANAIAVERLVEIAGPNATVKSLTQGGHGRLLLSF
jgi:hypothetical protein